MEFDKEMVDLVDSVLHYQIDSARAFETARLCPLDTLACALEALQYRARTKFPGPLTGGDWCRTAPACPARRDTSIADASQLDEVLLEYPIGHARRRAETVPLLIGKFKAPGAFLFAGSASGNPERFTR